MQFFSFSKLEKIFPSRRKIFLSALISCLVILSRKLYSYIKPKDLKILRKNKGKNKMDNNYKIIVEKDEQGSYREKISVNEEPLKYSECHSILREYIQDFSNKVTQVKGIARIALEISTERELH